MFGNCGTSTHTAITQFGVKATDQKFNSLLSKNLYYKTQLCVCVCVVWVCGLTVSE